MPAQTRIIHFYVCLGAAGGKECEVIMSILDKVKEFAESEEVQKGIQKVKENTEEILREENVNKCVNRAKEAATTISESDTYKKAKEGIKKVTETEEFKDGMNDLKDFGAKSLSLTSKGLDKLSKKLIDQRNKNGVCLEE